MELDVFQIVAHFRDGLSRLLLQRAELVARAMELPSVQKPALRDILAADKAARELVRASCLA